LLAVADEPTYVSAMAMRSRAFVVSAATMVTTAAALVLGVSPAPAADPVTTFDRPHPITFGDPDLLVDSPDGEAITIPASGSAAPYPSQIVVDQPGVVLDVDVAIGFAHERVDDLDIMLVGPQGQAVVLMSDTGGTGLGVDTAVDLDDEAGAPLADDEPVEGFLTNYRPANYGDGPDTFPVPAPAPTTASPALAAFDQTVAAGTWSLYVVDDTDEASGSIGWWRLKLDLAEPGTYPSGLQVSGLGPVTDVDVTIRGFDTEYAQDINFLLVGPRGQQSVLLNDAGGDSDEAVNDVDLRFDDEAAFHAPEDDPLGSGPYQPTSYDRRTPPNQFPPPAPPAPSPLGPPTSLAVFDGTDPNGTWRLFGFDDAREDLSSIDGWSLHIRWADAAEPTGTVAVAGGDARTRMRTVVLDIGATDPAPGTGVTQVRLSNDGASYGLWVPYAATTSWQLSKGNGVRTVFVQLRDAAGNVSPVARDTIVLDTKAPRGKKSRPEDAAHDVSPGAKLKVWASERLRPSTVRPSTVKLTRAGDRVRAKVTYDAIRRQVVVDPEQDLAPGTYRLKVTTKVADLAGNRWDQRAAPGRQVLVVVFRV
jgi:subtilisin-like proprotein convertase family protein